MELEAELRACPFCGCAVELSENERDDNDRAPRPHRVYSIQCGCCETFIERVSLDWWSGSKPPPETDCDRDAKAEVIAAWNRRAAEAELATLRADNERLGRERDEALAEIERMTPQFVAYEYLESPAGREIAEAERDILLAQVEGMRGDEATADRLLSALWRYGNLHTVKGVIYPETGSHADTLKAADDYLYQKAIARAALTKEPS